MRSLNTPRLALVIAILGAACASSPSAPSSASRTNQTLRQDCALLLANLAEYDVDPARFSCEQRVDFDGDGRLDRAFITSTNGTQVRLAVALGARPAALVETMWQTEYQESGRSERMAPGFGWLTQWRIAKREGTDLIVASTLGGRFTVADALGDALWMSSSDVAALFYRSQDGWILMHLGY